MSWKDFKTFFYVYFLNPIGADRLYIFTINRDQQLVKLSVIDTDLVSSDL